jgi:hypothetical protein
MHSQANVTGDALSIMRQVFDGPLLVYPDSGFFQIATMGLRGRDPTG